jgi:predicted DNA-binding transcriptional regulator YafY
MGSGSRKRDRTARLLKLQVLLWQSPHGITIGEMARKCTVSERTIFRDLKALESELNVPLWEEGSKRGLLEGYFLPPVNLTLLEAINIFLASRLMLQHLQVYNPHIVSTFMKINTIVPQPLRRHVQDTIDYMETLPINERRFKNFEKLTNAWLSHHQVKFNYQEMGDDTTERIVDPYFIEPSLWGHSSYVIACDHQTKTICYFKTDQIISNVVILDETYETPPDFNINNYYDYAFGVFTGEETLNIKLRFHPRVSKMIKRTVWHPSQVVEQQLDGSIIMTLKTRNAIYLRGWILGWGMNVEVLEPKMLRNQIIRIITALRSIYTTEKK